MTNIIQKTNSPPKKLQISPREFARLWSMLLTKVRTAVKDARCLPTTILTMESGDEQAANTLFVMERLDSDPEFNEEMRAKLGFSICLVTELWNGISIKAIKDIKT